MDDDVTKLHLLEEIKNRDKAIKEQQPKIPKWIHYDDEKEKYSVNIPSLVDQIMQEYKWLATKYKEEMHYYEYQKEGGYWELIPPKKIKTIIQQNYLKPFPQVYKPTNIRYAYELLTASIPIYDETIFKPHRYLVNFKSKVYDLQHDKFLEHSPHYYFTSCIPYDLQKDGDFINSSVYEWFSNTLGNATRTVMEYIGYMFEKSYEPIQAFMFFYGKGGEGKSTMINYISSLFNENEVSHIPLNDLATSAKTDNFAISGLKGKRLNAYDDTSKKIINDTSILKVLTGGGIVDAKVKNREATSFSNYAKLLFACNALPEFRDTTKGFNRRIYIIPFEKMDNFTNDLLERAKKERGLFAYECIKAYKEQLKAPLVDGNKTLSLTDTIKQYQNEWIKDNDPVQQWLDDNTNTLKNVWTATAKLYENYENYCRESGINALSRNKFTRELKNKGFKTKPILINGKTTRSFELSINHPYDFSKLNK